MKSMNGFPKLLSGVFYINNNSVSENQSESYVLYHYLGIFANATINNSVSLNKFTTHNYYKHLSLKMKKR